jgi:flagellar basal body-associated protein FliL
MPEEEQKSRDVPRRRRSRLALILPFLALAGIGLWFWTSRDGDSTVSANQVSPVRSTFHLDTFVLNLAGTEQRAYLRVGIDLGLNQETKRAEEIVPIAQVRDTILGVLGDAKADDLLTAAGKTKLKQEVLHALQERLPQLGAEQVYFTEFLIQR